MLAGLRLHLRRTVNLRHRRIPTLRRPLPRETESSSIQPAPQGGPPSTLLHPTDKVDGTQQPSVILKHAFLASLRDQNQVLFYRLMQDHLKDLLGILYTPGEPCLAA